MIDTHCHLLPAIDDGPKNSLESLALARQLIDAGVSMVFCTPHFSRRFQTDQAVARERIEAFRTSLAETGLPLRIALAAEVSPSAAMEAAPAELKERELGKGHLLVELEPDTPAGIVDVVLERLRGVRLTPVFAHPERCHAVSSQPHLLDSARRAGALVQVVAPSLTGRWGKDVAAAAWGLLDSGRVDLLASDAHRARHAGERLTRVLHNVSSRVGRERLVELIEVNPAKVARG